MRISKTFGISAALTLTVVGSGTAAAQSNPRAPSGIDAILACQARTDPAERLACYDSAAGTLATAVKAGDVTVVDREDVNKSRRSLFGFSLPDIPFLKGDGKRDEIKELTSTVKTASAFGTGYYRFTLVDGDATWETTEATTSLRDPRPGDPVKIERGALGSYWVKFGKQMEVRARRVR